MDYFWVNVGTTHEIVLEHQFLWAPEYFISKKGTKGKDTGWLQFQKIKKGDVIFCNNNKEVVYVAIAKEDAMPALRPPYKEFKKWEIDGYRVEVDVQALENPLPYELFRDEIIGKYNDACIPKLIDKKQDLAQTYCAALPQGAGDFILSLPGVPEQSFKSYSTELKQQDYRNYTYPMKAGLSWDLPNENVAIKCADTSLVKYGETGIPQSMVGFFISALLKEGESEIITLVVNDKSVVVEMRCKPGGRHSLNLRQLKRALHLGKMEVDKDTLWFERVAGERRQFVVYSMCANKANSVRPKPSQLSKPSKTTAVGTTERRVGQEYFKQEVSKACGGQCVVTGVKDHVPSIMIGSHIKPWSLSNDDEKLDGNNGLLLSPHIDKLFDRYLITFSEEGKIVIAPELDVAVLEQWGIDVNQAYPINPEQQFYMQHHRMIFNSKRVTSPILTD